MTITYLDITDYGCVGDGTTDNEADFRNVLALATSLDLPVYVPHGEFLITDAGITVPADEFIPPAGALIIGSGPGSVLRFRRTVFPAFYGLSLQNDGITVRDLSIESDVNGGTGCAGVGFSGPAADILFDNVRFAGVGGRAGNWSGMISGGNAGNVRFVNCLFETLDSGAPLKGNSESSHQRDFAWSGCIFRDCTDALSINSPAGSWHGISVSDCDFTDIGQFSVAFAGEHCSGSLVSGCRFHDTEYEALHYEALTHDHAAIGNSFSLTNQTAGVAPSNPGGINGAIQIITGANDIRIVDNGFDLHQNTEGSPNGIVAQPGGIGAEEPYNLLVQGNTFLTRADTFAIFAQNVGYGAAATAGSLDISNNTFENDPESKADFMLRLLFTPFTGSNNRFVNPKAVLKIDDNSFGSLGDSQFVGDLSTLDFLDGNGDPATSVVFRTFSLIRPFTADAASSWQDICPDGTLYDGIVSMRYVGNGVVDSFTKTVKLRADSGTLTIADEQANAVGSVNPVPGAPHWRIDSGKLQSKAFRSSSLTGTVQVTFQGAWFA